MKTCSECLVEKTLDEFYSYRGRGEDGKRLYRSKCKLCLSGKERARRLANPELVRARDRDNYRAKADVVRARRVANYALNAEREREASRRYRAANAEKVKAVNAAWRAANPWAQRADLDRIARITRIYNITIDDYWRMYESQNGQCAVCGTTDPENDGKGAGGALRFRIDHDHSCCPRRGSCGECVRGLLCGKCNMGLGLFADSTDVLTRALEYLRR